ncbi:hypothetical protein [Parapedobacter koreensis]|uniref:Uncharacterized protein n=1 Tax=Parapedobacter koreensis TaxID=332977 RepID=A0A1H7SD71_9SPHI|nr:hypothetical protein [Parapedobacter koreensis]SEL70475.1 hypothetical protein SAMN05421740_108232 [Parapedobacter koreensis]
MCNIRIRCFAICFLVSICITGCRKNKVDKPDQGDYRLVRTLEYANSTAKEPRQITDHVYDSEESGLPSSLPHTLHFFSNAGDGLKLLNYLRYSYKQRKASRIESYQGDGALTSVSEYFYEYEKRENI